MDRVYEKCFLDDNQDANSNKIGKRSDILSSQSQFFDFRTCISEAKSLQLAKLIPKLCKLLTVDEIERNEDNWLTMGTYNEKVKDFAYNIFQSFALPVKAFH